MLHYTGMLSTAAALARLCDPEAQVSAHYLIDETGQIHSLVPEDRRAWHAGAGSWRGMGDVNSASIGIELVNPGHEHGYRPFPKAQMAALLPLCQDILRRHPIPARNVIGHSDAAPLRKQDPGELFDWQGLAKQGIGLYPKTRIWQGGAKILSAKALLKQIGYDVTQQCQANAYDFKKTLIAFQRHFHPRHCDGVLDQKTFMRLLDVAYSMKNDI